MYAVIMAGGGGTRLWPLSRAARPKPFLPLLGDTTLLQATVARLSPLIDATPTCIVVTDGRYADLVREQLPDLPAANLLREPMGRNTAAAAVAFAAAAIDRPDDEVMVVLPADQRIVDEAGFRAALAAAARARRDRRPGDAGHHARPVPRPGYGYVLATGGRASVFGGMPSFRVERFVEKPNAGAGQGAARDRAARRGTRASSCGAAMRWRRAWRVSRRTSSAAVAAAVAGGSAPIEAAYPQVRSTSIDYALLEPASAVGAGGGRARGGRLERPRQLGRAAGRGATIRRRRSSGRSGAGVIEVGADRVLIHAAGGRLVAVVGICATPSWWTRPTRSWCAPRDAAQDVKQVVERLVAEGRRDLL